MFYDPSLAGCPAHAGTPTRCHVFCASGLFSGTKKLTAVKHKGKKHATAILRQPAHTAERYNQFIAPNMNRLKLLVISVILVHILSAQENKQGEIKIGYMYGPSFSNLLDSEAPHKINIFGSDITPAFFSSSDLTQSPAYADYKTGLFKDILYGISAEIQIEYFFLENFSLSSGISFESKGINLDYSKTTEKNSINDEKLKEIFKLKIVNNYLIVPFVAKQYLLPSKKLYISGGFYTGYLISSRINWLNQKIVSDDSGILSDYSYWLENWKDRKRLYTNKLDFGFSIGTGYERNLTDKLIVKAELISNMSVRKIDSKYNNDFSITPMPSGSNLNQVAVRSTNYYGLNSNAKNINLLFRLGLAYKL